LIDIYFDNNSDWVILKADKLTTDNPEFYVIRNMTQLNSLKEKISVITFPVGRGTTGEGAVYVFKDNILLKEVPFFESYISDVALEELFEKVSKEEAKELSYNSLESDLW
jgi:hypothetical protein